MKILFIMLFVAGGLYFLAASIINKKKSPRWVSMTTGAIGLLLFARGLGMFLKQSDYHTYFNFVSSGLILGMFFCLGVSGNIKRKKKPQPGNREVRETPVENLTE